MPSPYDGVFTPKTDKLENESPNIKEFSEEMSQSFDYLVNKLKEEEIGGVLRGEVNIGSFIKANSSSGLWLGAEIVGNAPFSVSMGGDLKATSGIIGGWTLASDKLSGGAASDYIALVPGTGIQAGDETFGSAPFRVTNAGVLYAESGTIGGWTLASSTLSSTGSKIVLDKTDEEITVGNVGGTHIQMDGANTHIRSSDYSSGALGSGWNIDSNIAEFNNIRARGIIKTSVFEKDVITSVGGNLLVSNSDVLDSDMTASDTSDLVISGDSSFNIGDILRIKDGVDDEWLEVTAVNGTTYTVTRDKAGSYGADSNPTWKKGTAVVEYGASGDGLIYMTASETNAPYLNVLSHAGSPWSTTTTRVRLGNLNGFLGYSSDEYGIAIGETNKYLKYDPTNGLRVKGDITITGGNATVTFYQDSEPSGEGEKDGDMWIDTNDDNTTYVYNSGSWNQTSSAGVTDGNGMIDTAAAPSGAGLYLGSSYMGYYDSSAWKTYMDSSGNFYLGGSGGKLQWNGSSLYIEGQVKATSGDFTGTVNVGTAGRVYIDGANEVIKVYDASSNLRVELGNLG